MATRSADIAVCAKVTEFRTFLLSLSVFPFIFPCHSLSVSDLSIHIHLSDGSFRGAYSWHAGVFISTSNPFRFGLSDQSCCWEAAQASAPQQHSVLSSPCLYVIAKEKKSQPPVRNKIKLNYMAKASLPVQVINIFNAKSVQMWNNLLFIDVDVQKTRQM